ncbi:hypothetical protein GS597_10060 [Synechococcales cyanobacterium C]|uniref:DUF2157 domain-containing protein n=1 Tax=Petrachloros mirabilis ULC683 TaxID=2781853 RepID=A0A8K2A7F5_9CYAN|nr:hypothetical protein [Petrachloros mirabilis]NCJ06846.1 hypothetical protein [Petrachloros mirabilis ULC683]
MTPSDDSPRVLLDIEHPALLEGLESWLTLGLISDDRVRRLASAHLVCALPQKPEPVASAMASPARPRTSLEAVVPQQSRFSWRFSALMAEFSVLWLLILGVFLVVVSSAVLAATQWQQFSAAAQYSILGLYTLAFGGASLTLGRRPNLILTAHMLQLATLMLIPVNFWMMDVLGVIQSSAGWGVVTLATVLLTLLWVGLAPIGESQRVDWPWLVLNGVLLSWLHWGWATPQIPLIASYGGVGVTIVILVYRDWSRHRPDPTNVDRAEPVSSWAQILRYPTLLAVMGALLLLLLRAMLVAQIPLASMGLALGSCGWLLGWLTRRRAIGGGVGLSLVGLGVGRVATGAVAMPWPALGLSGLAIGLFGDRWQRHGRRFDLGIVLGVGLQSFWLLHRLIPEAVRQDWVAQVAAIAGTATGLPGGIWSVTLFPYLWGMLFLATRLRQPFRRDVRCLGLLLGLALSLLSLNNPWLRAVNLGLTTGTLVWQVWVSQAGTAWIYLTQGTGLAAIAAFLAWRFPTLSLSQWGTVWLGVALLEWGIGGFWPRLEPRAWRQSAWWLGLGLATLSYLLLLPEVFALNDPPQAWMGARWLAVPLMLMVLSQWGHYPATALTAWLSLLAFVGVQPLTFGLPAPRIVGLVLAWVGTSLQTRRLAHPGAAVLAIGFGLTLGFTSLWLALSQPPSWGEFLMLLAASSLLLWLLEVGAPRLAPMAIYQGAARGWAWVLSSLTLILLTITVAYTGRQDILSPEASTLIYQVGAAAFILLLGLAVHTYARPQGLGFWGLAWSVDLILLATLRLEAWNVTALAVAHLGAGFTCQLAGDLWVRYRGGAYRWGWHGIPLAYGLLAWIFGHTAFTSATGFYSLGMALIGLGVGRRGLKLVLYLALVAGSLGFTELVLYRLLQVESATWGDGFVVLAALALGLALAYHLWAKGGHDFWQLSATECQWGGHLHWGACLGLLGISRVAPLSLSGTWGWVGVTLVTAVYALYQGRTQTLWVYLGLGLALAAVGSALGLTLPASQLWQWGGAIAALLAIILYALPWSRWGWSPQPWKQIALILPGFVALLTLPQASLTSLLLAAASYAGFALTERQVRLSYLGLLLANLALWRFLFQLSGISLVGHATLLGGSVLYITQVDPSLGASDQRHLRHWLRLMATGLICLAALYESDGYLIGGLLAAGGFLVLTLAGLGLQVRAFLYMGTLAFALKIIRQLWLFIASDAMLLWAIGIVLGLILIWAAATFEARRNQIAPWMQTWVGTLSTWE